VQFAGTDITTKPKFTGERAQELIALHDWDRGGHLHHGMELFVGQANHG
jgi:hypothetical protein